MASNIVTLDANGKTNAYDVILAHGFVDALPDVDFYDGKFYRKDNKDYAFDGWNVLKVKGKYTYPSLNMREIN